jgi:galactokinase
LEIAKAGRHAENNFMGKPSGLMDQTASASGGFVFIDFHDDEPFVESISLKPDKEGYTLCVVNTGSDHANLTADYAAMPVEMAAVAALLGNEVLGFCNENEFYKKIPELRQRLGDRALLRAMHFFGENERVAEQARLLKAGRMEDFLTLVNDSGLSSFMLLQNIYKADSPKIQPISLALALSKAILSGKGGASRIHGGGFAGTILAFVPHALYDTYSSKMDAVFGPGSCQKLSVRLPGAVRVF